MSTDRELVALAAKAASIELSEWDDEHHQWYRVADDPEKVRQTGNGYGSAVFDPLGDDGDALRLAVRLGIQIWRRPSGVEGVHNGSVLTRPQTEPLAPDPYAATRRAIVRAAAEIGKAMP